MSSWSDTLGLRQTPPSVAYCCKTSGNDWKEIENRKWDG